MRAREFIPQLAKPRDPRNVAVGAGVVLIAIGLVKKVAIADYLAREVVDPVFGVPEAYAAPDVALAAYAYAAQIYCDFSGYTDIAIGVALLMGFVFPQNFNSPYRALSFRDFWRRWHMTLSRFLRDFVYIPLGGDRGGKLRTARNLMITMVLGGLWHGAAWGSCSGGRCTAPAWWRNAPCASAALDRRRPGCAGPRLQCRGAWLDPVPHGEPELAAAFLSQLAEPGPATLWAPATLAAVLAVIGFQLLPPDPLERLRLRAAALPSPALGLALAAVVAVVGATVPSQGVPPFIYSSFDRALLPHQPGAARAVAARGAQAQRPPRAHRRVPGGSSAPVIRGFLNPHRRARRWTRGWLANSLSPSVSPQAGCPTGSRSTTGRTTPSPSSRTRVWERRVGSIPPAPHAWHAECRRCLRLRSIPESSGAAPPRQASLARCSSPGIPWRCRSTWYLHGSSADTDVEVERDPHVGTGISKNGARRLGKAVHRADGRAGA